MERNFHYPSFAIGMCVGLLFCICIYAFVLKPNDEKSASILKEEDSSTTEEAAEEDVETEEAEEPEYDITVSSKSVELTSGENFTFYTPSNFYSLTDQYLDSIGDYYDVDKVNSESMFVVGDNKDQTLADTIINMDIMSDLPNVFTQLYKKDYSAKDIEMSSAYTYMKTGEIPDSAEDNFAIDEIDTFKVGDIEFRTFAVSYTTTYTDENGDEKQMESKEVDCYSNTDDAIEIIVYQTDYDTDVAVDLIRQFCGYVE